MRKSSRIFAAVLIAFLQHSLAAQAINPVLVTNVLPNNGFGSLVISGKYLYSVGDAIRIFDLSNPANPIQVGTTNLSGGGSGLALSGNYAFVLDFCDSLVLGRQRYLVVVRGGQNKAFEAATVQSPVRWVRANQMISIATISSPMINRARAGAPLLAGRNAGGNTASLSGSTVGRS